MAEPTREEEIKAIWSNPNNRFLYKMLGWGMLILIGVWIGRLIYTAPDANQAWGYGVNLFTGILSTAATVLILDQLAERRADRKAEEALKRQLVMDAASISNEIAKNAVHQLWRRAWLLGKSGLLKGADLRWANLREAKLGYANLAKANLNGANLQGADLYGALLVETALIADLNGANLTLANLNGADLRGLVWSKQF